MAGNGLPIYYKNSKLVVSQGSKKRWKEYYLLVCTVVGFVILIAGVLWFVPSVEEDKSYSKAYYSFTGPSVSDAPQEPGVIDKPNPVSENDMLKREVNNGPELDPRQRRLEQEGVGEGRQDPVPVPGMGRPNNIEGGAAVKKEEGKKSNAIDSERVKEKERNNGDEEPVVGDEEPVVGGDHGVDSEVGRKESEEDEGTQKEVEEDPVTKERREKIVEV